MKSDAAPRFRLAVWKLTSCDGCQLSVLDCEDELLALADEVEIAYFREASRLPAVGTFDLSLVEGSVSTSAQRDQIREIRARSRWLVPIGACATAGGIQALRNYRELGEMARYVYARPEYIDTLETSTAVVDHVRVEFELRGCPIDKRQLLEVISAYRNGRRPAISASSVCVECKRAGNVCVMVAHGTPCLGPVTHAGCGAICPHHLRGCYGCFGPMEQPNSPSLSRAFLGGGVSVDALVRAYRTFNANAPAFRDESVARERKP